MVPRPEPTFFACLSEQEYKEIVECLRRKKDCLAWSYERMIGLPLTVTVHCLNVRGQTPVKQPPRKYPSMVVDTIVREVDKLINVDLRS